MGDDEDKESLWSPKPAHKVKLDHFLMGQYPVNQELWEAVMGENPSHFKGPHRPVERVSWDDTQVFLERLNRILNLKGKQMYRLPTEAEWEFTARGGIYSQGFSYAGSEGLEQVGWFRENSQRQTQPVGLLQPNELGLYDMSGNVWEWCQDCWDRKYYEKCHQQGIVDNPEGTESGLYRVLRGGSWSAYGPRCQVAFRVSDSPDSKGNFIGLRLARKIL